MSCSICEPPPPAPVNRRSRPGLLVRVGPLLGASGCAPLLKSAGDVLREGVQGRAGSKNSEVGMTGSTLIRTIVGEGDLPVATTTMEGAMRGQTRTAGALAMAVLLAASSGCATVLRGSSTSLVRIHSDPPGARVMVDGEEVGVTPVVAPLSRRRSAYRLRLEKDGCFPAEHELRRSTSPWAIVTAMHAVTSGLGAGQEGFHGFLLGPAIVFSVDAFSGAMFELPRTVQVALRADVRGGSAGETSGKCGTDISATGGGVSIPLSVPLDVPGNLLPPRGRLAVDTELRRRLRAVRLALPGPLVGSQPGVSMAIENSTLRGETHQAERAISR